MIFLITLVSLVLYFSRTCFLKGYTKSAFLNMKFYEFLKMICTKFGKKQKETQFSLDFVLLCFFGPTLLFSHILFNAKWKFLKTWTLMITFRIQGMFYMYTNVNLALHRLTFQCFDYTYILVGDSCVYGEFTTCSDLLLPP